jgi:GH35 family endo-1,4-beta-xylanase
MGGMDLTRLSFKLSNEINKDTYFVVNMSFNQPNPAAKAQIAYELRQTISELKDRGLLVAAKW